MSVNARTFQVVHAIRTLASDDKPTTAEAIGTLFRERKNTDKAQFGRAYLSPSTLQDILIRLATEEGLLSREKGEYHLTPRGSLLADHLGLLPATDTNSNEFIENYKAHVSHSHLLSLWEAGDPSPKTTVAEVATATGLSQDSARIGLEELLLRGVVMKHGFTYKLVNLPTRRSASVASNPLDDVLNSVDETPMSPVDLTSGDDGMVKDPSPQETPKAPEEPETSDHPFLMDLNEEPEVQSKCSGCGHCTCDENDRVEDQDELKVEDQDDLMVMPEWAEVPISVQSRFIARAEVVGMTLGEYLLHFDQFLIAKARAALLPPQQRRSPSLRSVIIGPLRLDPQRSSEPEGGIRNPNEVEKDPCNGQDGEEQAEG